MRCTRPKGARRPFDVYLELLERTLHYLGQTSLLAAVYQYTNCALVIACCLRIQQPRTHSLHLQVEFLAAGPSTDETL